MGKVANADGLGQRLYDHLSRTGNLELSGAWYEADTLGLWTQMSDGWVNDPKSIGAKEVDLVTRVLAEDDLSRGLVIAELGPGTGKKTAKILSSLPPIEVTYIPLDISEDLLELTNASLHEEFTHRTDAYVFENADFSIDNAMHPLREFLAHIKDQAYERAFEPMLDSLDNIITRSKQLLGSELYRTVSKNQYLVAYNSHDLFSLCVAKFRYHQSKLINDIARMERQELSPEEAKALSISYREMINPAYLEDFETLINILGQTITTLDAKISTIPEDPFDLCDSHYREIAGVIAASAEVAYRLNLGTGFADELHFEDDALVFTDLCTYNELDDSITEKRISAEEVDTFSALKEIKDHDDLSFHSALTGRFFHWYNRSGEYGLFPLEWLSLGQLSLDAALQDIRKAEMAPFEARPPTNIPISKPQPTLAIDIPPSHCGVCTDMTGALEELSTQLMILKQEDPYRHSVAAGTPTQAWLLGNSLTNYSIKQQDNLFSTLYDILEEGDSFVLGLHSAPERDDPLYEQKIEKTLLRYSGAGSEDESGLTLSDRFLRQTTKALGVDQESIKFGVEWVEDSTEFVDSDDVSYVERTPYVHMFYEVTNPEGLNVQNPSNGLESQSFELGDRLTIGRSYRLDALGLQRRLESHGYQLTRYPHEAAASAEHYVLVAKKGGEGDE